MINVCTLFGPLEYCVVMRNIFTILVCFTMKNLATLLCLNSLCIKRFVERYGGCPNCFKNSFVTKCNYLNYFFLSNTFIRKITMDIKILTMVMFR
jgi:hypothetical protein